MMDPQQPPVARVVKGAKPGEMFIAKAKPVVATAKRVGIGTVRVTFGLACFVGVFAMLGGRGSSYHSSTDWQKFDFKLPKYDYQMPKFDYEKFQRDLDRDLKNYKYTMPQTQSYSIPQLSPHAQQYLQKLPPLEKKPAPAPVHVPTHMPVHVDR